MTGSFIIDIVGLYSVSSFVSSFNTILYADTSVLVYFLWYVNSDDFEFFFGLTLSPSSGITHTGIFSSGYDVVILSSSIPGTKYSSCALWNIFRFSTG